jgi:hypothetical protein
MPAHRQSALLLHGLSQADQRWILAQLPRDDASVLRGHLRELKQLGIPADPSLAPSSAPAGAHAGAELDAATLARASAAGMQLALSDEPAWLVAQLLAVRPWPWRAAFLDGLAPERRGAITSAIATASSARLAPRAEAALLAALARKMATQLAPPAMPGKAQPAAGERRKFKRWF